MPRLGRATPVQALILRRSAAVNILTPLDVSDSVGVVDAVVSSRNIELDVSDLVGDTDSIDAKIIKTLDVSDVASLLHDGGAVNWLGIESSFETDTDVDGIADGWRVPTGGESSRQAPDVVSLVATFGTGHGSWAQRITKNNGVTKDAVLVGPQFNVSPGMTVRLAALVKNSGAVITDYGFYCFSYNAVGTLLGSSTGTQNSVAVGGTATPGGTFIVGAGVAFYRPVIAVNGFSTGTLDWDSVVLTEVKGSTPYDYVDPANRIQLISGGTAFIRDYSDLVTVTDSASKDTSKNVVEIVSALRDGGGANLLGIESSFEIDTNLDGIADGWRQPDTNELLLLSNIQAVETPALVAVISGGHGVKSQQITKTTGAGDAMLVGPLVAVVPNMRFWCQVRCFNSGGSAVFADVGIFEYDITGTPVRKFVNSFTVNAGQTVVGTVSITATTATTTSARPVIGLASSPRTVAFDQMLLMDGLPGAAVTYTYVDPANRIVLIQPIPYAASDQVAVTDSFTVTVAADRFDVVALTDLMTTAGVIDLSCFDSAVLSDVWALDTTLNRSDGMGLTDSVVTVGALAINLSDTVTLIDVSAELVTLDRADAFTITDVVAVTQSRVSDLSDAIGLSDSVATVLSRASDLSDALGLSDSVATVLSRNIVSDLSDSVGVTDLIILATVLDRTDSSSLLDATAKVIAPDRTDITSLIDARSVDIGANRTDLMSLLDTVVTVKAFALDVADSVGLRDAGVVATDLGRADQLGLADVAIKVTDTQRSDVMGSTDSVALVFDVTRSDLVVLNDMIAAARVLVLDLSDSVGLRDAVSVGTFAINVSDSIDLTDATSITAAGATSLDISDSIGLVDAVERFIMANRFDSIGLIDVVDRFIVVERSDAEALTDIRFFDSVLDRSDIEALADARSFDSVLNYFDTEALVDTRSFDSVLAYFDAVALTDSRVLTGALERAELAALTDLYSLAIAASRVDQAGLTDILSFVLAAGAVGWPKIWNGTAWITKPAKVWNGSAWVAKPVKVWTGSTWKTVI